MHWCIVNGAAHDVQKDISLGWKSPHRLRKEGTVFLSNSLLVVRPSSRAVLQTPVLAFYKKDILLIDSFQIGMIKDMPVTFSNLKQFLIQWAKNPEPLLYPSPSGPAGATLEGHDHCAKSNLRRTGMETSIEFSIDEDECRQAQLCSSFQLLYRQLVLSINLGPRVRTSSEGRSAG